MAWWPLVTLSHGRLKSHSLLAHWKVTTLVRPQASACTMMSIINPPTVGKLLRFMAQVCVAVALVGSVIPVAVGAGGAEQLTLKTVVTCCSMFRIPAL